MFTIVLFVFFQLYLQSKEFTWRSNNVVVRGSHCMYEENQPSEPRNTFLVVVVVLFVVVVVDVVALDDIMMK